MRSIWLHRLNDRNAVLGFIGFIVFIGLYLEGRCPEAVSKLPENVAMVILAKLGESVDFAKYPFASTIHFPRSEIAATIQCLISAYARF